MDREKVAQLFRYSHLPPALQKVSQPFHDLAIKITETVPESAERTLAIRDLWSAKNLIVWAAVPPVTQPAPGLRLV